MTSPGTPDEPTVTVTHDGATIFTETYPGDGRDYFHSPRPLRALIFARILHRDDIPAHAPVTITATGPHGTEHRTVPLRPHNRMDDHHIPYVLATFTDPNPKGNR